MARDRESQPHEAEDTFAVRFLFAVARLSPSMLEMPRRYGRVKAKPPPAVRSAQP